MPEKRLAKTREAYEPEPLRSYDKDFSSWRVGDVVTITLPTRFAFDVPQEHAGKFGRIDGVK